MPAIFSEALVIAVLALWLYYELARGRELREENARLWKQVTVLAANPEKVGTILSNFGELETPLGGGIGPSLEVDLGLYDAREEVNLTERP